MSYSTCVIERKILYSNLENIKKYCPRVFAMVKANAYGCGVKEICLALKNKVDFFGVACLKEALEIRGFDKTSNILIVGICENIKLAIENNISITIENLQDFNKLLKIVKKNEKNLENNNKIAKIHVKINSGMNRLGLKTINEFKKLLDIYFKSDLKNLIKIEGVFTHFASKKLLASQVKNFKGFIKVIPSLIDPIIHIGGGIGKEVIQNFENVYLRVGIDLYTEPAYILHLESKVIKVFSVKTGEYVGYDNAYMANNEEHIAVIPLGYADGIKRKVSGECVKINNKNYKIIGNICMDIFFVCVDKTVKRGDKVIINLNSWAKKCDTINYEILTSINHRRFNNKIIY